MAANLDSSTGNQLIEHVLSPWCHARTKPIDRITIHHAAAVNVSAHDIAAQFTGQRRASANWCIGTNGELCVSVPENRVALTSSSYDNDSRAVTIECANAAGWPNWEISAQTYKALIALCVKICMRYGKTKLLWMDKTALSYQPAANEMVLTVHQWFDKTACPGPYLMSKMPAIAETVTNELKGGSNVETRFNSLDECPSWARATIGKMLNKGIIEGTDTGLDLSMDMVRVFVVLDRAGVFD